MSNSTTNKLWVRIVCIILAALMIIGVATTAIFIIVDFIQAAIEENEKNANKKSVDAVEVIALPEYDANWTVE